MSYTTIVYLTGDLAVLLSNRLCNFKAIRENEISISHQQANIWHRHVASQGHSESWNVWQWFHKPLAVVTGILYATLHMKNRHTRDTLAGLSSLDHQRITWPVSVGSLVASRVLYRWSSFCFFYGQFACGLISDGTTSTAAMNLIYDTSHYLYDKTTRLNSADQEHSSLDHSLIDNSLMYNTTNIVVVMIRTHRSHLTLKFVDLTN